MSIPESLFIEHLVIYCTAHVHPLCWAGLDFVLHICNSAAISPTIIFNLHTWMHYPRLLHWYLCFYQSTYISDVCRIIIMRGDGESLYRRHLSF